MRSARIALTLAFVTLLAATAAGQGAPATTAPQPKPMPKAEPVLKHIPAGTLGYLVVNDITATNGRLSRFLGEIGLGQIMAQIPGGALGIIRAQARLGPGFNPNGGFAAVVLDPKEFGIDLLGMMGIGGAKTNAETPKFPIVLFVPGKDPKAVFPTFEITGTGSQMSFSHSGNTGFIRTGGDYILVSPSKKALDAVTAPGKKTLSELTKDDARIIATSDAAAFINMKIVGPLYVKMLEKMMNMGMMAAPPATATGPASAEKAHKSMMQSAVTFYRDLFSQMDSATVGCKLTRNGVLIEEAVSFAAQSAWAEAMASFKSTGPLRMDRVPDLPYVLAGTFAGGWGKKTWELNRNLTFQMLETSAPGKISEEMKKRIEKLFEQMGDEIKGGQFVIGAAPAQSGVFAVAVLINCKDSSRLKKLVAEKVALADELLKIIFTQEEMQKLTIKYEGGIETIGTVVVDAVTVAHPKLSTMDEEDRAMLIKVLGEDRLRIRIAAPDKTTLVATFGGSKAFLTEALNSARRPKPLLTAQQSADAAKYMPKRPSGLFVFNVANLMEAIEAGRKIIEPESAPIPVKLMDRTPIVMSVGGAGNATHIACFVPNSVIREVVTALMMLGAPGQGGAAPAQAPAQGGAAPAPAR